MRKTLLLTLLAALAIFIVACGSPEPVEVTVEVPVEVVNEVEVTREVEVVNEVEVEVTREVEVIETVIETVEGEEVVVLPAVDPIEVSGDIVLAGSSTVFPLAEAMIARFVDEGYSANATYDSIGSGGGFERFCVNTESDISGASRPIKDSEVEQCVENGREPIEFRVGTDALAVVVSSENDFATDVTIEELAALFSTAETWADVRADWPAEPVLRYSPGTDSGTFDYFVEEVFDEDEGPILASNNLELSEDDNVLVQGVTGSPYAITYFGYAYFSENADALTALSIDGIAPEKENVDNASYPLARPLYIYSTAGIMAEKPQVAQFVNFFLSFVNEEIEEVGYFAAGADDLNGAKISWIDALTSGSMSDDMMEDDAMMMDGALPEVDPIEVGGDIVAAGSSTVFPLAEAMIARFVDEGYADNATYDSIGSGGGFERFCVNTESDISGASRPIKDSEVEQCQENGREPIEFRVGTDALAVVVSSENDFVTDVTLEELAAIFSTAETWSDVRAEWPNEPILRYSPGTDSGTFDYFVEEVFDEDEGPILGSNNLELSEDDNVLVQGVTGSPFAITYFGYAYFSENADALTALSIDGIEPAKENVDNASYPLARPLYIYSTAGIMAEKPQVADFINFFLTFVNEEIEEVGYFAAGEADLGAATGAWKAAMSGEAMMDDGMMEAVELPEVDPIDVGGDIVAAGSSTVFPLAEAMIARFVDEGYADNATYDSIGSGGGFERFCVNTESDISGASRPIKDSEVEQCQENGREPIEFRVGTDALAVVVSSENDFVTDVTLEELAAIFSTAETWSDVRAEWPNEPILRYSPGTDSGTFDYFVEEVFDEDEGPILGSNNLELSEDDNVLVQGVTGSPFAITYFGYAYFSENADALTALSIDGIEPAKENVDNASYPLARPLYIYSTASIMAEKPQVADFINFFLTFVNEEIEEVGYFAAGQADLDAAKKAWMSGNQ